MSSIKSQAPHHDYGLDQVIRGGKWREEVWDRIARLSDAVGQLPDGTGRQTELHTAEAFKLAGQSWSEWFARHGSHIEATWRQLRLAEESLVREVPPQQVRSQAILAREKGLRYLGRDDSLVLALDEKLADPGQSTEATESLRGLASAVLSEAHRVSDDRHRRLRALSGQLWLVAIGLAVLAIAVVIIVDTSDVNLLPKPKDASWNPAAAAMSAGFIGALFSAIPSLSSAPPRGSTSTRFAHRPR